MMDQPFNRSCTNFAGRNSDYGAKFGFNCNFKDMHEILPSCEEHNVKLIRTNDNDSFLRFLNWNFLNGESSSKFADSDRRSATRPHKLSLKLQQQKCKDVFNKKFEGTINRTTAIKINTSIN